MSLLIPGGVCLLGYLVVRTLIDRQRLNLLQFDGAPSQRNPRAARRCRRATSEGGEVTGSEVLLAILAGAAARLSAGVAPEQVWDEFPGIGERSAGNRGGLAEWLWKELPPPAGWHAGATQQVLERAIGQVVAADELARTRGMSLARLLARVQASLETELELHTAQVAALTPARTSARLLQWLPAFGLGLGALLGFNPVAVLLGSGVGRACLLGATMCVFAGRFWSKKLLNRALLPSGS